MAAASLMSPNGSKYAYWIDMTRNFLAKMQLQNEDIPHEILPTDCHCTHHIALTLARRIHAWDVLQRLGREFDMTIPLLLIGWLLPVMVSVPNRLLRLRTVRVGGTPHATNRSSAQETLNSCYPPILG